MVVPSDPRTFLIEKLHGEPLSTTIYVAKSPAITVAVGSIHADSRVVSEKYGTCLFPETWIIDPGGVIRARFDGAKDWSAPLAVEVGQQVGKAGACPVEFFRSMPRGPYAGICGDES